SVQRRSVVVTNAGRQDIILVDAELSNPENDITITDDDGDSFPIRLGRRQKVTLQLQLVPSFSALDKVEEVTTTVRFISAASAVSDPLFIRYKVSVCLSTALMMLLSAIRSSVGPAAFTG
ncbi:hypothetical protein FOZ62_019127, partial [Perkinsus olseni]